MSTLQEIRVPDIGDYKEVGIVEVLVSVGETVVDGQCLIVVETDKASMEIPTAQAGLIKELNVAVGDKISEGSLIALMEVAPSANLESAVVESLPTPAPTTVVLPIESVAPPVERTPKVVPPPTQAAAVAKGTLPFASPSIRKLARELGVPLDEVAGTGPRGRISRDDVESFVKNILAGNLQTQAQKANAPAGGEAFSGLLPWPQVDFAKFGPVERQDLSRIKKISGANLHRNWVMIPHVTNHEDADITELEAFRVQLNAEYEKAGVKVTLLALLIKACVVALKQFPGFNASLDGDQIVLKQYYHIGFAADTPNGLVVPVIRDADQKGVIAIAKEMADLSAKAREGKLGQAEMSGGCFTISSLGGIGGTYFTPIINAPEVAILGVGKSSTKLVWNGKEGVPRLILPLSLSWDHRVIDGAEAGRFNACLARLLADFRRLIL
ncbi:dihydrolipoyllysine-residue acetyltransferase [Pseudomonas putida]|uniref:Acetyltransferase component of pyruvate dehydrogenase complex n=1 Tax=Pseudomonas putida TaxID=303 RepID=A0AAW6PR67_PSEPU|nr:dihydrolipoyllysine-residue acetyltransferase [Pseudomonas putida]MDF3872100.1 dihydrolipoyllysine-residue acetyltransferase [Pseudomonas putida]MDF3877009.1 dihydrolipoyllysine-residue acetyltransferase [Pseudomonas putida]